MRFLCETVSYQLSCTLCTPTDLEANYLFLEQDDEGEEFSNNCIDRGVVIEIHKVI